MQALPTFALVLTLSALVALPSMLAILRKHPSWLPITIVNVFLGWTIVGWIAALVWVLRPVKARTPRARKAPKARPVAAGNSAANDNVSATVDAALMMPASLDADVYEEWLERGSALAHADSHAEAEIPARAAKPIAA